MNLSPEISSSLRQAASVIQSAYAQAYWLPTNQRRDKAARNVRYASNSDRSRHQSELTLSVESRCGAVALGRTYLLPVWSKYWSSISSIANLIALITVPVPHRRPG